MAEVLGTNGQAPADSAGTTATAPVTTDGDSGSTVQATASGPVTSAEESFFDPSSVIGTPLEQAYKQMQGAWTKKLQGVKQHQTKIDAYDNFQRDPMGTMQQLARQYGYQLVQPGAEAPKDFDPKSWDDVMAQAKKEVLKDLQPVFGELRELKKQNVEGYLDSHHPDWRTYEDNMMETLQQHPSLVKDPDALYRASVPAEVWESRATQKAMQKLKAAGQNSQISGGTTTTRPTQQEPKGPLSFDQAVEVAKKRLASKGIRGAAG